MKNNIKKIIGVAVGVSFLSAMAYTAFAVDLSSSTLSGGTSGITSTATSTTDTTTTTSTQSTAPTTAPLQPEFTLEGTDIITGTEKVYIDAHHDPQYVQYVSVSLRVADSSSGTALDRTIGQAKIDPLSNKWVYSWDSTNKPNGVYILSALVVATKGAVIRSNEVKVTVKNETTPITTTITPTISTAVTDTTPITTTTVIPTTVIEPLETRVALKGGVTTIVGETEVYVKVSKTVSDVYVGLIRSDGSELYISKASFDGVNSRWVSVWDSTDTPDGSYKLFATVMSDGKSIRTSIVPVTVKKEVAPVTTTTSTASEVYLKNIETDTQKKLEEEKASLSVTVEQGATQKVTTQPVSEQRVLQRTGTLSTLARPSKLTTPIDYEKVIDEKSLELKEAVEQGDTNKRAAIVAEIVRIARGSDETTPQGAVDLLAQKVEEGVRKLEQVIIEQEHGVVDEKIFKVERVEVAEVATRQDGTQTASKIAFRGKGLPDSFVTLYIFSLPIVVTVKTDADGNWNYTLDKELEDGNHQVYVGITDVKGKVVVKSNPLPFVKTASAITVEEALAIPQAQAAPSFVQNNYFYGIITVIILVLVSIFIFLGIKMSKTSE